MYKHIDMNKNGHLQLLSSLSDPVRLQIVMAFHGKKKLQSGEIAALFPQSRQTISHHLQIMERAGVVSSTKQGREVYYELCTSAIIFQLSAIIKVLESQF